MLPTDADLDAFCLDYFPAVHQRFSSGMERLAKQNLLLARVGADELLAALGRHDPERFAKYVQVVVAVAKEVVVLERPTRRWRRSAAISVGVLSLLSVGQYYLLMHNREVDNNQINQPKTQNEKSNHIPSSPPVAEPEAPEQTERDASPAPALARSGQPELSKPVPAAAPAAVEKLPAYRGVLLDKSTKDPMPGVKVSLVGTRCRSQTDSDGIFDFDKCDDSGMARITQPRVRLQLPPGGRKTITCNDIPLRKDRQRLTRIELGTNCIHIERPLAPPDNELL